MAMVEIIPMIQISIQYHEVIVSYRFMSMFHIFISPLLFYFVHVPSSYSPFIPDLINVMASSDIRTNATAIKYGVTFTPSQ